MSPIYSVAFCAVFAASPLLRCADAAVIRPALQLARTAGPRVHAWPFPAMVLNLDARPDRWAEMQQAFAGIEEVQLQRMPAIPHRVLANGSVVNGCTASHIKLVEEAFGADPALQVLLVLEDDAAPRPGFGSRFRSILSYALSHLEHWDIINLGAVRPFPSGLNARAQFQRRAHDLFRVSTWKASTALLVNRRAVRAYQSYKAVYPYYNSTQPMAAIDYLLASDPSVVSLVASPSLLYQQPGWSDITANYTDYTRIFEAADRSFGMVSACIDNFADQPAVEFVNVDSGISCNPWHGWGPTATWPQQDGAPVALPGLVLNLDGRPDRWAEIQQEFAGINEVRLQRVSAIPHRVLANGTVISGCTATHIKAVVDAFGADPQAQVVLVLEDDAVPRPGFSSVFARILSYALSHLEEWDIISLGALRPFPPGNLTQQRAYFQKRTPDLIRVSTWAAATGLLVNRRTLPAYQRYKGVYWRFNLSEPDAAIDHLLAADPSVVTLVASPSLLYQRPGWSDNTANMTNYTREFEAFDETFIPIRNVLDQTPQFPALEIFFEIESGRLAARPYYGWGGHPGARSTRGNMADKPGSGTFLKLPVTAHALNLAVRPDRWSAMQQSWAGVKTVRLQRQEAVMHRRSSGKLVNGCTASHIKAVEEAFAADPALQVVLVLEDDAVPRPDFDSVFPRVLSHALFRLEDWDIIHLGPVRVLPMVDAIMAENRSSIFQWRSPDLLRISVWSGSHALLVNRRALPAYARMKASYSHFNLSDPWGAIDYILCMDEAVVTLAVTPQIVDQRPGVSDIQPGYQDYGFQTRNSRLLLCEMMGLLTKDPALPALEVVSEVVGDKRAAIGARPYLGWGAGVGAQGEDSKSDSGNSGLERCKRLEQLEDAAVAAGAVRGRLQQ